MEDKKIRLEYLVGLTAASKRWIGEDILRLCREQTAPLNREVQVGLRVMHQAFRCAADLHTCISNLLPLA